MADGIITFELKFTIRFWDALKMRIAGGKYMEKFWIEALERITVNNFKKEDSCSKKSQLSK